MAQTSEELFTALYRLRQSELQDQIAAAQAAGQGARAGNLQDRLDRLPVDFSRELMRDYNRPVGEAYKRGLQRTQSRIEREARRGVGEQGQQLALGREAGDIGANIRAMYEGSDIPAQFRKSLNVALTNDQIAKLQEMGYDPYQLMTEGAAEGRSFGLSGFNPNRAKGYRGRDFEGGIFSAAASLDPLSPEFFAGLGVFVDPRSGEQVGRRPESIADYGISTVDPRSTFVQQAERSLYNRAARAAMRGADEERFLARLQGQLPEKYEAAMQNFADVLAPEGQELGSSDPYMQQLQELQGGLGSIVRSTYGTVQPAMESGQLAPSFNQFRQQAVQATGVTDPIALQQYYNQNVAPSYQYSRAGFDAEGNFGLIGSSQDQVLARNLQQSARSPAMQQILSDPERQEAYNQLQSGYQAPTAGAGKGAAQAPTQSAGKGAGKGATNQQAQTAQSMYTGFS